jgi:hypothetical protein
MLERGQIRLLTIDMDSGKIVDQVPGGANWVKVKEKKTIQDTMAINGASVTGKITTAEGEQIELGTMNVGAPALQTLIQMTKGWGGPAFCLIDHEEPGAKTLEKHDHEAIAITPENLAVLIDEFAQKILNVVEDNNPRIIRPTKKGAKKP